MLELVAAKKPAGRASPSAPRSPAAADDRARAERRALEAAQTRLERERARERLDAAEGDALRSAIVSAQAAVLERRPARLQVEPPPRPTRRRWGTAYAWSDEGQRWLELGPAWEMPDGALTVELLAEPYDWRQRQRRLITIRPRNKQ